MLKSVSRGCWVLALLAGMAWAQNVPDAPSATRPPQPQPQDNLPSAPTPQNNAPAPAPLPQTGPVPRVSPAPADQPPAEPSERDQMLETMRVQVNFVVVPVTVKDTNGHLVEGLMKKDFAILEDGVEQPIKLFTSDPFPLSTAVVLDLSMPEGVMRKVNETLPALAGAFSQFDEVAFYTYGTSVEKALDFSAVTERYYNSIKRLKRQGQTGGVPVVGGPLGQGSPTVNGRPVDPGAPHVYTPRRESHVLNDAMLAAALDLSKREKSRRKVIFVISDGREYGSRANYAQVLKVLQSNGILVYAVAVGDAALPVYSKAESVHLPGSGYGNILPRYALATGGDVLPELDEPAIEAAYNRLTEEARNQYTLGYTAKSSAANNYREIEVRVRRPNLKVRAKAGYYPLPISPSL